MLNRLRPVLERSRLLQIGVIMAVWAAGETISRATGLPVPGSVIGMVLMLALLVTRRVSLPSVNRGAEFLLAEMLLFFVPVVMVVFDHREFIGLLGLKVLAIIVAGTLTVMITTALTVDLCYRWRARHAHS